MKSITIIILLLLLFFLNNGCAKKDSTSNSESSNDVTEVEGNWLTNCILLSDNTSVIRDLVVEGKNVTSTNEYHSDSSCQTDSLQMKFSYTSLVLTSDVTFESGATGKKFTLDVEKYSRTPKSQSMVNTYNNDSRCGFSNWSLNNEKEFTGLTCAGTAYPVKNTTMYNMYRLSGNNLYLGSFSSSSYPDSVSTSWNFVKQ